MTAPQMVLLDRCIRLETESEVKLVLTRTNLENYVAMAALTARVKRASPAAMITAPDKLNGAMSQEKTAKQAKRSGHPPGDSHFVFEKSVAKIITAGRNLSSF